MHMGALFYLVCVCNIVFTEVHRHSYLDSFLTGLLAKVCNQVPLVFSLNIKHRLRYINNSQFCMYFPTHVELVRHCSQCETIYLYICCSFVNYSATSWGGSAHVAVGQGFREIQYSSLQGF